MSWKTSTGYDVTVGCVDRRIIDARRREPPKPPMIRVDAWADEGELVPDHRDPGYLAALRMFHLELLDDQLDSFTDAIKFSPPVDENKMAELAEIIDDEDMTMAASKLKYEVLADAADANRAVAEILYNSTVTERGLQEAAARYKVTWRGGRISLDARGGEVKAFPEFEHRRAAKEAHYTWDGFCALPGPEQSAIVAHHKLEAKLEWMASKESKT